MLYSTTFLVAFLFAPLADGARTPPNCELPTNSPQFVTLCRLPEEPFLGMLDVTVNMICDFDCRCTHGATARGGRCGVPIGTVSPFCVCDYNMTPRRQPLLPIPCPELIDLVGIIRKTPILGLSEILINPLEAFCDVDCQCSHGYQNDGNNRFSTANGDVANRNTYCICGNARTLSVVQVSD